VFDGESALCFDGSSTAVTCSSTPSLNLMTALTIEAWIKPDGWGEIQGNGYGRIVDKSRIALFLSGHSTYGDSCLVLMLFNEVGGMSASMTPAGSIVLGEWQHVAVTYDGAASLVTIYINGIAQPLEQTRPPSGEITDNEAYDLLIGNAANLGSTFDGAIDEVRVWSTARTDDEIRSSLGACLPGPIQGLVGYWPMNEGNGTQLMDHSGQANHGTVSDGEWVQGTSFEIPTGADGHSVIPSRIRILDVWPNPTATATAVTMELSHDVPAHLTISDLAGRCVRSFDPLCGPDERCIVVWNGCDDHGARVPAGTYMIRLDAGARGATRQCVVVR
jgi:hypothetical protein